LILPGAINKINGEKERDLAITTLKQLSMVPKEILRFMQSFDYAQQLPKIVVFYDESLGHLTRADAILFSFLNRFGFDIIFYTPTGKQDIENYLEPSIYTIHRLEEMVFDVHYEQPTKTQSFIHKIRKRFFD